jgi:hypothetical protein
MTDNSKQERAEIVKSGTWVYAEGVRYEVWIVKQNFEYFFEEGYDDSETLNESGESYKILYLHDGMVIAGGSEFLRLDDAISAANKAIPQGIDWDDHRIQPLFGGRQYRVSE